MVFKLQVFALDESLLLLKIDDFSNGIFFVHFECLQDFELAENLSLSSCSLSICDILLRVPPVLFKEEEFIQHWHCLLAGNISFVVSLRTVCLREFEHGVIDVLAIKREERLLRILF